MTRNLKLVLENKCEVHELLSLHIRNAFMQVNHPLQAPKLQTPHLILKMVHVLATKSRTE